MDNYKCPLFGKSKENPNQQIIKSLEIIIYQNIFFICLSIIEPILVLHKQYNLYKIFMRILVFS